jgi:hypothetical protein
MLKSWLFIGLSMALLSIPTYAKTTTFTSNPYIDYNFTKNYLLSYSNGVFKIGKITITPSANISNTIKNLTNINNNIIMKDFGYYHEFGFNLSDVSLNSINSIAFDLKGMKRYDDVSFTDGKIRLVFNDLIDKGSLKIFNDSRIILYNPTTLNIDPIIELLSNSTNKAYYSLSTFDNNITRNFANATNEATATEYNKINTSNNIYWSLSVFRVTLTQYRTKKFTFNLSSVGSPINSIIYCYEGYHDYIELGFEYLYWYNMTLKNWQLDQITNYGSDTTICKTFSTTQQISDFYNSTSKLVTLGTRFSGNWLLDTTSSDTDFINLTVNYGANTCTYGGSGNWLVNINDNCTLSSSNTVTGNIYLYGSNGFCNFQAIQKAHAYYYNVSANGWWYYNNYRWLY